MQAALTQLNDPAQTLSARVLDEMQSNQWTFWQLAQQYSRRWHADHLAQTLPDETLQEMMKEATLSLTRQRELEAQHDTSFEEYLAAFYQQYQSV